MTSTALPVLDTPVPAPEALQHVLGLPQQFLPVGRVFRTREVSINPLICFDAEELSLSLQISWRDLKKEASGC